MALTRAGRELIDQAFTDHMRNERRLLDTLTSDGAAHLEALLTSWLQRVEPPAAAADQGVCGRPFAPRPCGANCRTAVSRSAPWM